MSFFSNKVVIVTGGSDGIGRALIGLLIDAGAKVATCGRQHDKLYALQLEFSQFMLHTMVCDVSNEEECKRFIHSTVETFGTIDILINNAGISMRSLFDDTDTDVIRRTDGCQFYGRGLLYKSSIAIYHRTERNRRGYFFNRRIPGTTWQKWLFCFKIRPAGMARIPENRINVYRRSRNVGFSGIYYFQYTACST